VSNSKKNIPSEEARPQEEHDSGFAAEIEELKRDMRSAQLTHWLQKNQQQVIAGAVVFLLVLAGAGLWIEQGKTQRASAANLYHQAMVTGDAEKRQAMLESVANEFDGTTYAVLSNLQLAKLGDTEQHLNAVIHGSVASDELVWQARLDLAEYYLQQGNREQAMATLSEKTGQQYEQLRHYLMAEASASDSEKRLHLEKALNAISNDMMLKDRIEAELKGLSSAAAAD